MNELTHNSEAELADRTVQLVALSLFIVALLFVLSIVEFFADDSVANLIDWASKIMAVSVIALMVGLFALKFRSMPQSQRRQYLAEDGFLQIGFQRAMAKSWMLSFVALVMLQALDQLVLERLPELPLKLFIQAILAIMLGVFSIAFFFITRQDSGSEWEATNE